METACRNQAEEDISSTIGLIKGQTQKCFLKQFELVDQYLLLVLMVTYITVVGRLSHISVNLGGDEYREMHRQFEELVANRIASGDHLLRESALGGELTDGYLHFVSPKHRIRAIIPTTINSNDLINPSAIQSTTSTVPPTTHSHDPLAMSPTTTSNQNPPADAHVIQSPTISMALTRSVPSGRRRTNNGQHNSMSTTLQAVPLAAAPSSSLEEDFPGERILPSPPDRRKLWYASEAGRGLATIQDAQQV